MILAPISTASITEHLKNIAEDGIDVFLLADGGYRGSIVHGTRMVNQMRANHGLGVLETLILGHGYLAAGLLTALVKGNDRIGVQLQCDGPIRGMSVESTADGQVRGYLFNAHIPIERPLQRFDMSPFIGTGTISVTRTLESAKSPTTGTSEIIHGNLAQDLAQHFVTSEQTPTAINLSIQFDRDGVVVGAGGLLLQALPACPPELHGDLDKAVRTLPSLGAMFAEGRTAAGAVQTHFSGFQPELIGTRDVAFTCSCSKERFESFVAGLPLDELEHLHEHGPFPVQVTCHNCNSTYEFSQSEIDEILDRRREE